MVVAQVPEQVEGLVERFGGGPAVVELERGLAKAAGDDLEAGELGWGELGAGIEVALEDLEGDAGAWELSCCVGIFDRTRRRFVRRSCGYAGLASGSPP